MQTVTTEQVKCLTKAVKHTETAQNLLRNVSMTDPEIEHIDSLLTEAYVLAREKLTEIANMYNL